jgi:hypothetical protein
VKDKDSKPNKSRENHVLPAVYSLLPLLLLLLAAAVAAAIGTAAIEITKTLFKTHQSVYSLLLLLL